MPDASDDDKSEASEKRVERRIKLAALVVPLFTMVLGAAIAYGVTVYSGRMRVMRYTVASSSGLFPKPEIVGKEVGITLDKKPVENLSSVTIFIGSTDQDLVDVPLHLRFAPIDGQPPRLIQARMKLAPERFKQIELTDAGDASLRIGYELRVMNRGSYAQIDCLFEGSKAPDVTVDTLLKGVEMQRVPFPAEPGDKTVPILVGALIGTVMLLIWSQFNDRRNSRGLAELRETRLEVEEKLRIKRDKSGKIVSIGEKPV